MKKRVLLALIFGIGFSAPAAASEWCYYKGNFETGERTMLEFVSEQPLRVRYCYKDERDCNTVNASGDRGNMVLKLGRNQLTVSRDDDIPKQYNGTYRHSNGKEYSVSWYARRGC